MKEQKTDRSMWTVALVIQVVCLWMYAVHTNVRIRALERHEPAVGPMFVLFGDSK